MGSALAGIGGAIGGIVGHGQASGDQTAAQQSADQAYKQMMSLGVPPDMAKQVILQQYKSAGTLTPELEQAINMGPSAVAGIQADQTGMNAQAAALQQMQQAGHTGVTAEGQLATQNAINATNAAQQGNVGSIIQQAQARGEAGSGASLAAQLLAAQSSANQASSAGLQQAAQAQQAALNATAQSGQMGNQMVSQGFNIANTKAQAADQFQRFNVANQQAVANQNVGVKNQAQAYNLQQQQAAANANTQQANQEALRQNAGQMQTWQACLTRDQAQAGAAMQNSNYMQGQANAIQNQAVGMGSAIGGAVGSAAQAAFGMPPTPTKKTTDSCMCSEAGFDSGGMIPHRTWMGKPIQNFDDGGDVDNEPIPTIKGFNDPSTNAAAIQGLNRDALASVGQGPNGLPPVAAADTSTPLPLPPSDEGMSLSSPSNASPSATALAAMTGGSAAPSNMTPNPDLKLPDAPTDTPADADASPSFLRKMLDNTNKPQSKKEKSDAADQAATLKTIQQGLMANAGGAGTTLQAPAISALPQVQAANAVSMASPAGNPFSSPPPAPTMNKGGDVPCYDDGGDTILDDGEQSSQTENPKQAALKKMRGNNSPNFDMGGAVHVDNRDGNVPAYFEDGGDVKDTSGNNTGGINRTKNIHAAATGAVPADPDKRTASQSIQAFFGAPTYAGGGSIPDLKTAPTMQQSGRQTSMPPLTTQQAAALQIAAKHRQMAQQPMVPATHPAKLAAIDDLARQIHAKMQAGGAPHMLNGGYINSQHGSLVPGHAPVDGDSPRNDTVHAIVSPDEIVLPRSITTKPDAPERAKEFVKGILASKKNHQRG